MSHDVGLTARQAITGFVLTEFVQAPHRRLPWHEHASASVCFVVSGTYAERARGRELECPTWSMVFKPAAERHADVFGKSGGRCLLIEMLPDRSAEIELHTDIAATPGLARSARLAGLGQVLYREFTNPDDVSPLALEGGILEVLAEAARETRDEVGSPPAWLRRARALLHDHVNERLTLASISRDVGIHPAHLARTFRKHYRRTIGEYVRGLRIERASRELADRTMAISEISLRAGFYDQSHFGRVFKRHTGVTPGQFRALSS